MSASNARNASAEFSANNLQRSKPLASSNPRFGGVRRMISYNYLHSLVGGEKGSDISIRPTSQIDTRPRRESEEETFGTWDLQKRAARAAAFRQLTGEEDGPSGENVIPAHEVEVYYY